MSSEILKDLLSISGSGTVTFERASVEVKFTGALHPNGIFDGTLTFPSNWVKEFFEVTSGVSGEPMKTFEVNGRVALWGGEIPIRMQRCIFTLVHPKLGEQIVLTADYEALEVDVDESKLDYVPANTITLLYELANVSTTFRVIVDTSLGKLSLAHAEEIEQMQDFMTSYGIPIITSQASLEVKADGRNLGSIVEEATDIVDGFLKITSLSQGAWHVWVLITALEEIPGTETLNRLYVRIRHPKMMGSAGHSLTNPAHSANFVRAAWKGYTAELNSKHGFDTALEWYVDACGIGNVESKFLSATTCLELLIGRHADLTATEFLLNDEEFASLSKIVNTEIEKWTALHGINEATEASLTSKIPDLKRRSFQSKTKQLLDDWKLRTDDLSVTLGQMISIRNEITHGGSVRSRKFQDKLIPAYYALMEILVRVFLAMLNYDDQYFSMALGGWVKFANLRTGAS